MITKELIDRFLKNECSPEEHRIVSEYLEAHPEELERHLPENEFVEATGQGEWDRQRSEDAYRSIQKKLTKKVAPIRRLKVALAAASVILVIGMVWLFSRDTGKGQPTAIPKAIEAPLADVWEHKKNMTASTQTILLNDGSTIDLAPNSEVEYRQRTVHLQGEALFSVAKDKTRPFTVKSGDLTTTVLGTSFSVKAYDKEPTIKVHLFTGRVAVNSNNLLPGEELIYDKQQMTARIVRPTRNNMAVNTLKKGTTTKQPDWYMFGGQPLTQVFDQLSDYYGIDINYIPADVSNRYFTGKFSKTDSLDTILKDISLLHDLSLRKTDGVYYFRKKKH